METTTAYTIEREDGKLVITIPQGLLSEREIEKFLAYLTLEAFRSRSALTQEQADELAREVDAAVWARMSANIPHG